MESIQLAQMLADLSDLSAAQEAEAALSLVNANKSLPPTPDPAKIPDQTRRHHERVPSASAIVSRATSPAKHDKFGRRIVTPPMTRASSAQAVPTLSSQRRDAQPEDDVTRATSLIQLYEIRAQLKQQDQSGLNRARERINAIQSRQHLAPPSSDRRDIPDLRQNRFSYPKAS